MNFPRSHQFKAKCPLFFVIAFLLLASACEDFSNDTSDIRLYCGGNITPSDSTYFVRILTAAGPILDSFPSNDVSLQLRNKQSNVSMAVSLSEKGCAEIPKDSLRNSRLEVIVKNSNLSGLKSFSDIEAEKIGRMILEPSSPSKVTVKCDADGIFASRSFPNPLAVIESGSIEKLDIDLVAESVDSAGNSISLFKKKFEESLNLSENGGEISTANIPEGSYYIRAVVADLVDNFGSKPVYLNEKNPCILTVIKTIPKLSTQFFSRKGLFTIKRNQTLSFDESQRANSILYCKQPFESRPDDAANCQNIAKECKDRSAFKPLSEFATDTTGLYDYFFISRDRAGNESDMQCQPIAVVDSPATFSVKWTDERWNADGAYMIDAVSEIAPIITISQDQILPAGFIGQHLTCRVEFEASSGFTIKGDDAVCTSESCKGRPLGDFVPCDQSFAFSLSQAWNKDYVSNSRLKLVVQSDGQAGEVSTVSRRIGIQSARWQLEEIPTPRPDSNALFDIITISPQTLLSSMGSKGAFIWNEDQWIETNPIFIVTDELEQVSIFNTKIVRDSDEQIYGMFDLRIQKSGIAPRKEVRFYRFVNQKWEIIEDLPRIDDCTLIVPGYKSGFACLNQSFEIHFYNGQSWSFHGSDTKLSTNDNLRALTFVSANKVLLGGTNKILSKDLNGGDWETLFQSRSQLPNDVLQILVSQGRVWAYATDTSAAQLIRFVLRDDGTIEEDRVATPQVQSSSLPTSRALWLDSAGNIFYFGFKWNEELRTWEKKSEVNNTFLGFDTRLNSDSDGKPWYFSKVGLLNISEGKSQFWPTGNSGIEPLVPIQETANGGLLFMGMPSSAEVVRIYRVSPRKYLTFNKKTSGLDPEAFPNAWIGSKGEIQTISYRKGEILSLESPSWVALDKFPNSTANDFADQSLRLKDGGMALLLGSGLILKRNTEAEWRYVFKLGDKLKTILPEADDQQTITLETLRRLTFVGEAKDGTIVLSIAMATNVKQISNFMVVKPDRTIISKTVASFAKISPASTAIVTNEGILVGLKFILNNEKGTLFTLIDSNLNLIRKSTRDVSSQYERLMNGVGPDFIQELVMKVFEHPESQKALICAFRTKEINNLKAGKFFCFELKIGPEIALGPYVQTPSFEQISKITFRMDDFNFIPGFRFLVGKSRNYFVLENAVFESASRNSESKWETRMDREDFTAALGADRRIHNVSLNRLEQAMISVKDAGIVVLD